MATHDVDETVLTLIGSGQADTRPAIVKQTGLAPSTVSAAVSRLVEAGVIAEAAGGVRAASSPPTALEHSPSSSWEPTTASSP